MKTKRDIRRVVAAYRKNNPKAWARMVEAMKPFKDIPVPKLPKDKT